MDRVILVTLAIAIPSVADANAQELVEPGSQIRVTRCNPNCSRSTGTLLGTGQDFSSVVLHFGEELGPVVIPFDGIERLEVSRGRDRDRFTGGLLGALAFGGVTFWALKGAGSPCDSDAGLFCGQSTSARIGYTAAATAVGAAVGWLVAPGKEQWEVIAPSQLIPGDLTGSSTMPAIGVAVRF